MYQGHAYTKTFKMQWILYWIWQYQFTDIYKKRH